MIATHLGFYNTSSSRTHVRFQFSTHAAAGANVAPNSAFEAADIRIYRANDGAAFSATQRSSAAGITMTSPFDTLTGVHDVDIDLTDNTDAGFYASGYQYSVMLAPDETVDSQTLTGVILAYFEIGVPTVNAVQISGDSAAADALENAFDGTAGPVPEMGIIDQGTAQSVTSSTIVLRSAAAFIDDGLNGATVVITNGTQIGSRAIITDYDSATDTATVTWPGATPSGTPTYKIYGSAAGASLTEIGTAVWATTARTLTAATNITSTGGTTVPQTGDSYARVGAPVGASISADVAAVKAQTAAIETDTQDLQGRTPAALVGGRMDANVGAISSDATAADNAEAFFDGTGYAGTGNTIPTVTSVTGAVGSVTGAVGSVTGAVGSVTGSVGSVTALATGAITNASLAADTGLKTFRSNTAQAGAATSITLDASASAVNNFYNNDLIVITGGTGIGQSRFITAYVGATKVATVATWVTNPDATSTFAILPFDAVAGATAPTAAAIRAEIDANSTQLAAIIGDTNDLQTRVPASLVGGRMDASVGAMAANVMTAAAAASDLTTELQSGLATAADLATVDTVVDAIKAKTDSLTFTTTNLVDARINNVAGIELDPSNGVGSQGVGGV